MYGINIQLFNSKFRISIFDSLPKKLHFAKNLRFCANCAKLKFRFMRNFRKKIFPVLRKRFSHFVETLHQGAKVY